MASHVMNNRFHLSNKCHSRKFEARKATLRLCAKTRADCACSSIQERCASAAAAFAASMLLLAPMPACAQIETVSASTAMQKAQPLQAQQFDKGRVWLLLVGGAAGLFVATVTLENNEKYFPAITRANQAMSMSKAREEVQEQQAASAQQGRAAAEEAEYERQAQEAAVFARSEEAVLRGLMEARAAVEKEAQQGSTSSPEASSKPADASDSAATPAPERIEDEKDPSHATTASAAPPPAKSPATASSQSGSSQS